MNPKIAIPVCENCQILRCSIFNELKAAELELISGSKGGNLYKRGQNIFYEGTRPSGLYCLNSGKVKIYKIDHLGNEQIVRLAKEGDILGYRSLIGGELYSCFAAPLEDALVCFIPKEVFFKLLHYNVDFSIEVMKLLSHELKNAEDRVAEMAKKPVRERVAETLLLLKEFFGVESDGKTIDVAMTREDLANLVGTATETLIRFLSEFKHDKMVDLSGRKIKIIDLHKLIKTANIYD